MEMPTWHNQEEVDVDMDVDVDVDVDVDGGSKGELAGQKDTHQI